MIQFTGPSYRLSTRKADVQRTVNMYPVTNEVAGGKAPGYLESIPGLVVFSTDNATSGGWQPPGELGDAVSGWAFSAGDYIATHTMSA